MAAECGSTPSFHLIDSTALLPLYSLDTVLGGSFSMCPQMARCAPGGQNGGESLLGKGERGEAWAPVTLIRGDFWL